MRTRKQTLGFKTALAHMREHATACDRVSWGRVHLFGRCDQSWAAGSVFFVLVMKFVCRSSKPTPLRPAACPGEYSAQHSVVRRMELP